MRLYLQDWTWPLFMAIVLALALMLMCSGCVSPEAAEKVLEPGDIPEDLVHADASVGVWSNFLREVTTAFQETSNTLKAMRDILQAQARAQSQASQTVMVNQNKGSALTYVLGGAAAGVIGLLLLYVRSQKRLPASLARRMTALLSTVVEKRPEDQGLRDLILKLAPDFRVSRADIRQARKIVGTLPTSAGGA
jgi:L-amino acid N-acyltransferase YncA